MSRISKTAELETRISKLEEGQNEILSILNKMMDAQSTKKKSQTSSKEEKPQTRAEGIDAWCEKKGYTDADRKAFGEAKKAERELRHQAYEMACSKFTEKVDYKTWRAEYNACLKKLSK